MHYEVSCTVKVPKLKAYSAYTDFEATPRWSRRSGTVRMVRREGGTARLEMESKGRTIFREMKLFPPERVESEGETRFTRTKNTVIFEEVPAGTKVTASLDVYVKGRWGWVFRTGNNAETESSALEELASFARYVEGLP